MQGQKVRLVCLGRAGRGLVPVPAPLGGADLHPESYDEIIAGEEMVGQTLGHYKILEKLGEGGMGEVYLAEDTTLDRKIALKVLPTELAASQERLARFQREAKSLAALNHPHIVQIFSVEKDQGVNFLTMELVEGRPLSEVIPNRGLPLEQIFEIAIPLADALAAAHAKGVIHRDLKPSNVMVTREGGVKVLDFGLAKLVPSGGAEAGETLASTIPLETEPGTVMGTVSYMSPEHLRGEPITRCSDIFSLGAVLYEMATGERAFNAQSAPDVMSAILRDHPQPADELRPHLPHHLGRIIRRCLEKEPGRRHQSAMDVRNELDDLARELETEKILERHQPPAAAEPTGRQIRWLLLTVSVIAVLAASWAAYQLAHRGIKGPAPSESPRIESLAVLPFDNLMADPEQDYFVEGMHEALITDLSKISALRVISRTSTMLYKDTDKSLPQIARELGVDALIEGSVLRANGQVRVTAQLIDGKTDQHLWAESYDRRLENVLALLSEVAQAIAGQIEVTVTPVQERRLTSAHTVDPQAYDLYLKGLHFLNQGSFAGFRQALEFHRQAVERDPSFAAAWAALSGTYLAHGFFDLAPSAEMIPKSRAAAERALELDDSLGPAHAWLGTIALYFDWDWRTARQRLELALELDPTSVMARHSYADYLGVMGDCEGSVEQVLQGRLHDPLGAWANTFLVGHLTMCGHYERAVEEGRRAVQLGVEAAVIRDFVGLALWLQGRYEEALTQWRNTYGADAPHVQILERGYTEGGPPGAMLARAKVLASAADSRPVDPFSVATYYAAAGEADAAFEWLEASFEKRTPQLLHLVFHPHFDSVRDDSRYQELRRRIGLPE